MDEDRTSASPVCWLNEVDDAYAGYMTPAETADLVAAVEALGRRLADADAVGRAGLLAERARLIRPALPRIRDDRLHAVLKEMLPGAGGA